MKPLSIAFVVDRFGQRFGGAEAYGVALMRELAAAGHSITVYARDYDCDCGVQLPFHRIRVPSSLPSWLRVSLFAWRAARLTRNDFDIVHSHMNGWCGDVEVVHVTPVRYRWRVQPASRMRRLGNRISPRVLAYLALEARRLKPRPGHRVIAVSQLIAKQVRQAYGEIPVTTIPPGVDNPVPLPPEERQQIRRRLGFAPDSTICLLVARNPLRKGLPTALQALDLLPPSVRLVVVGANEAARAYMAQLPAKVNQRVQLVSQTSDVAPYYQAADICIHPTLNDSFGMAPLEAMSHGLPVVLSPAPWCGFAQYVQHGQDALVLTHPENAAELAQAVQSLVADSALRARLVQAGQAVVARHGWPQIARRYQEIYRAIVAERG